MPGQCVPAFYAGREGTASARFSSSGSFAASWEWWTEIACSTLGTMMGRALGMFSIRARWWVPPYSPSLVQDTGSSEQNSTLEVLKEMINRFFSL